MLGLRPARIGALALSASWLAPVAIALISQHMVDGIDADAGNAVPDPNDALHAAWLMLFVGAIVWSMAVLPVFLLATWKPAAKPESAIPLCVLGVLRAGAAWAALGVLYVPTLQIWQVSVATTVVEVLFAVTLLRYIAEIFDEKLARSVRQFAIMYALYRVALLAAWFVPGDMQHMVNLIHRATAPVLDAVVAILLLRAAGKLASKD